MIRALLLKRKGEIQEVETTTKKKRRKLTFLDYQLPDRATVAKYLEDFSMISYTDMAETMIRAKNENKTVTYGVDDTVKAAGFKQFDVKTMHVTVVDEDKNRETFTSGFYENASHSGKSSAETVKHDIAKMAVLTNNIYHEMLNLIDFFMSDRAGDSDVMLDEIGVSAKRRLKCNAHVLLAVDVALDKVFRDIETLIGVTNLIGRGAAHVFNSPKNSVWYLGLIAVTKLLSPSHNTESISLHKAYCSFLDKLTDDKGKKLKNEFKGFTSNRFGRVGELSDSFQKHLVYIITFFDEYVDENDNKLVLAVYNYIKSDWFLICCNVVASFYHQITIPIKKLIGMDEFKDTKCLARTWKGMKDKFNVILKQLEDIAVETRLDGAGCLMSKSAENIREALRRQLSVVNFFNTDEEDDIVAPLTNLGCESVFSSFGNDCKKAGGSTSLKTISDKTVISNSKLHSKERWCSLSGEEKRKKFKWASGSKEAKKVKEMEKRFYEKVRAVSELAIEARKKKKISKQEKMMENLERCKAYGGPLTASDIGRLEELTDEQVMAEAGYLKKTISPNLRFKIKVGNKFIKFSFNEIKQQIRDTILPDSAVKSDIDTLLKGVLVPTTSECHQIQLVKFPRRLNHLHQLRGKW